MGHGEVLQPVSLFMWKKEIAYGIILPQPAEFTVLGPENKELKLCVSSTKQRIIVKIEKILAPKCIFSFHKKNLEQIQNSREIFDVIVDLSFL